MISWLYPKQCLLCQEPTQTLFCVGCQPLLEVNDKGQLLDSLATRVLESALQEEPHVVDQEIIALFTQALYYRTEKEEDSFDGVISVDPLLVPLLSEIAAAVGTRYWSPSYGKIYYWLKRKPKKIEGHLCLLEMRRSKKLPLLWIAPRKLSFFTLIKEDR